MLYLDQLAKASYNRAQQMAIKAMPYCIFISYILISGWRYLQTRINMSHKKPNYTMIQIAGGVYYVPKDYVPKTHTQRIHVYVGTTYAVITSTLHGGVNQVFLSKCTLCNIL